MKVKKLRVEMVDEGFKTILLSEAVANLIESHAARIAHAAGAGFAHDVKPSVRHGVQRQIGTVWADTVEAKRREASEKALTRAIGGH